MHRRTSLHSCIGPFITLTYPAHTFILQRRGSLISNQRSLSAHQGYSTLNLKNMDGGVITFKKNKYTVPLLKHMKIRLLFFIYLTRWVWFLAEKPVWKKKSQMWESRCEGKSCFLLKRGRREKKSTLAHTHARTYGQKTQSHCVHRHAWGRSAMFQLIPHTGGQRSPCALPIRPLWFCACTDALNQATVSVLHCLTRNFALRL